MSDRTSFDELINYSPLLDIFFKIWLFFKKNVFTFAF